MVQGSRSSVEALGVFGSLSPEVRGLAEGQSPSYVFLASEAIDG